MLRLRLQRRGKNNYATYRVVVADQRAPIKGRFVADVGSYNPHTDTFVVNKDTVIEWIAKGVQPSNTVHNLLVTHGVITGDKVTSWKPKKKDGVEGKTPQETAPAIAGTAAVNEQPVQQKDTDAAESKKEDA